MDFDLAEREADLRDLCATFAEREIKPIAAKAWTDERCPTELLRSMGELGLLGLLVPEHWGGIGMSTVGFVAAMEEIGIDIARHKPITFEELDELEGLNFDLVVTLSPPAHHRALELTRTTAAEVEYWPMMDPTMTEGNREQRLDAYRQLRDQLMTRIRERFGRPGGGNE